MEVICFVCGKKSSNIFSLCSDCEPISLEKFHVCTKCGYPTSKFVLTCSTCEKSNYYFLNNFSLFLYRGIAKECLKQFKFNKDFSYAEFYAKYLIYYINKKFTNAVICPVPSSALKRKIKNGYQLDHIVKLLKRNGIKVKKLLVKKNSKTQKKLNKFERSSNLNGKFILNNWISRKEIDTIILLDDVFTTGATINECAKVLRCLSNKIYSLTLYRD